MSDTLANLIVPANEWVNIYANMGIPVGTPISIQNIGVNDIYLTVTATQPPVDYDAYNVIMRDNGIRLRNTAGDEGAWAFAPASVGKLNVRVLPE